MLIQVHQTRRCNALVTLTRTTPVVDDYGHANIGEPVKVMDVYAEVRQMSATKTMMTFQQADVVGVDVWLRKPEAEFDGIIWRGNVIHFPTAEDVDNRGRWLHIAGWYQTDNPTM